MAGERDVVPPLGQEGRSPPSPGPERPPDRDAAIDTLRGLAVVTMVAANLAAPALAKPHPLWLRLYGSFAAPLFVLLSGMMVAYTTRRKGYGLRYFLARGSVIVAAAALLDVAVWNIWPFTTVDVLYLIGVSLPVAHLSLRLSDSTRWAALLAILLLAPALREALGYADYPTTVPISGEPPDPPERPTGVLNHWIVDGWFPLFPWVGFSLLGVQLAQSRGWGPLPGPDWRRGALLGGAVTLACGVVLWRLAPGGLPVRGDYSDVFYPPTTGYVLTAVGLSLVLFAAVDRRPGRAAYRPLSLLGESALLLYLLHLVLIRYVITPAGPGGTLPGFVALYAGLVAVLLATAYAVRSLKLVWRHPPFSVRVLLGC